MAEKVEKAEKVDANLLRALKLAKDKEFYFVFVGPESNGKLILAKQPNSKVPKSDIDDAKKELKSNNMVMGKCSGPLGGMVFKVKKPKATLAVAIKKAVFRDTKLTVKADIQQLIPKAGEGFEDGEGETADAAAPAAAPAAGAVHQDAVAAGGKSAAKGMAEFDLAIYQDARQKVIDGLKALAKKFVDDKHARAGGAAKDIYSVIAKLVANPGPNDIDKLKDFISKDATITAVEKIPDHYHDLDVREPLLKAWKR